MKSKFNTSRFLNVLLVLFGFIVLLIFTIKILNKMYIKGVSTNDYIFLTFFITLIIFAIKHLNDIKYIVVQKEKIRFFSILRPFGKDLYYSEYIGIFQTTETGFSGSYSVFYLINHQRITRFKIMGLYYSNIDEIIKKIPLTNIKNTLSMKKYLYLLFTGKIRIEK
ncbi:hypothetical protein VUJ46_02475 [Chryseobacterium sp. MYb264]|uniref:hypothetical protein n=1 Tax=Chryseobacterium sp. MYb264 TaxID=2745153 RepID=UPI002E130181|nr:hypothetical protein VUJ46_02475 [Chryseobacterium sp. MYb264]